MAQYVLVVPTGTQDKAAQKALVKDQMVNINGCDDQFYRYKMPQLVATVPNAHASKMVKTSLVNIDDVSKWLQRPPTYLPNYIGYTVSAKAEYNKKAVAGENCYISGNYKSEQLNELVEKFIKEWVLCPKCNNPELNMKVKNKKGGQGSIKFDCSACGYSGKQKKEIMVALPKMTQHIFNNPPSKDTGTQKIEAKQDAEEREAKENIKKEKKSKKEGGASPKEGGASPSPRAAAAPADTDMEPAPEVAAAEQTTAEQLAAAVAGDAPADKFAALFAPFASGLNDAGATTQLFDALGSAGFKTLIKCVKTHDAAIKKTVSNEGLQKTVLTWLEQHSSAAIAGGENPKAVAKVLMTMYEQDQVEEEVVLAWHGKCADQGVKDAVQPIIEWLQEEDEDSDEEDD